jgi:hypothetical protein
MKTKVLSVLALLMVPIMSNSQVIKMELSEIIDCADLVIKGIVFNTESKWHEDEHGRHIYTYADVIIDEVVKGNYPEKTIRLESLGGKVGDDWEFVSNSCLYEKGEEFILFLNSGKKTPVGAFQGKIKVIDERININNNAVKASDFTSKIKKYIEQPSAGFNLTENDFIIEKSPSAPPQDRQMVTPQPLTLEIDNNSLKQEERTGNTERSVKLTVDSASLKLKAKTITPEETLKIQIDSSSHRQTEQALTPSKSIHLQIESGSMKQEDKTETPQLQNNLKITEFSNKRTGGEK